MSITVSQMIKPARRSMIITGFMTAAGAILAIIPFVAMTNMAAIWLNETTFTGWAASPVFWGIVIVVALLLSNLFYFLGLGMTHVAEAKLRHHLRLRLTQTIGQLPLGKVSQIPAGKLRKMICDDTAAIHTLVAHIPGDVTTALVTALVGIGYLFFVSWSMTLVILGFWVLIFMIVTSISMRGYTQLVKEFGEAQTELAGATVEMLQGMKEIKNFQATDHTRTHFNDTRIKFTALSYAWMKKSGNSMAFLMALLRPNSVFVTVAVVATIFIAWGWIPLSSTLPFFLLTPTIPEGIYTLISMTQHIYESQMAAKDTAKLLSEPPMTEGTKTAPVPEKTAVVELSDTRFSYEDGNEVLKGISFTANPGTITALVGPSGSGKSTIARLIARFYDADSGTVKVSGNDVREVSFNWLYAQLAIVLQEPQVIHDTIFENITLGKPNATLEEAIEAAQAARIHDHIISLSKGYQTILGDTGGFLSGGEKQRICLARAYLQNAPILLLDEATAQADPQSELEIHQALGELSKGRTVIIVAHRLSTIKDADQILFIEDGKIREQGTHAQLLTKEGRYASMWKAQQLDTTPQPETAQPEEA